MSGYSFLVQKIRWYRCGVEVQVQRCRYKGAGAEEQVQRCRCRILGGMLLVLEEDWVELNDKINDNLFVGRCLYANN